MATDQFFSLFGQLVTAGGGGALIAFLIFRFLGTSWIENKLAKDLEIAKSEISLLASRKMKLHDQEYVVFPEVWSKLNRAFASLGSAVMSWREMPDLGRMSEDELRTWMERSELSEEEKSYLEKEADKIRAYNRILDWRSLREANHDFLEFHNCLQANRIFLSPDIKDKLDKIGGLLREAWVAKKMEWDGHKLTDGKSFLAEAYEKYNKQAKPIMTEIEELVQAKLFPPTDAKGGR
jgi:hypothetical protein